MVYSGAALVGIAIVWAMLPIMVLGRLAGTQQQNMDWARLQPPEPKQNSDLICRLKREAKDRGEHIVP